jgi:hypothetical protein
MKVCVRLVTLHLNYYEAPESGSPFHTVVKAILSIQVELRSVNIPDSSLKTKSIFWEGPLTPIHLVFSRALLPWRELPNFDSRADFFTA